VTTEGLHISRDCIRRRSNRFRRPESVPSPELCRSEWWRRSMGAYSPSLHIRHLRGSDMPRVYADSGPQERFLRLVEKLQGGSTHPGSLREHFAPTVLDARCSDD
jgi:hypothetical protein